MSTFILFLFLVIRLALLADIVVLVMLFLHYALLAHFVPLLAVLQSLIAPLALLATIVALLAWAHFQRNFVVPDITALVTSAYRILLSSSVRRVINALLDHLLLQHASPVESTN
jgi:hypothetical protein